MDIHIFVCQGGRIVAKILVYYISHGSLLFLKFLVLKFIVQKNSLDSLSDG